MLPRRSTASRITRRRCGLKYVLSKVQYCWRGMSMLPIEIRICVLSAMNRASQIE